MVRSAASSARSRARRAFGDERCGMHRFLRPGHEPPRSALADRAPRVARRRSPALVSQSPRREPPAPSTPPRACTLDIRARRCPGTLYLGASSNATHPRKSIRQDERSSENSITRSRFGGDSVPRLRPSGVGRTSRRSNHELEDRKHHNRGRAHRSVGQNRYGRAECSYIENARAARGRPASL